MISRGKKQPMGRLKMHDRPSAIQGKCAGAKMALSHPKEDKTPLGVKLLPASQEPTSLQLRVMEHEACPTQLKHPPVMTLGVASPQHITVRCE